MVCFRCGTPNPEVARFCHRCGAVLVSDARRSDYYAANPAESVRALALVSTLMPHASAHRHHAYRAGIYISLLAALIAAAFGVLPVALVCAGVALPGMLLTYFHDHEVWGDEPATAVALGAGLAAAIGVGLGFLADTFSNNGLLLPGHALPGTGQLLEECVLLPLVVTVGLQVAPTAITARPKFSHTLDALTFAALGGTAFALTESIVIQHGAFSSITVYSTDAARDAFVALTLGFLKPVVYATAAALAVMRRRSSSEQYVRGLIECFFLVAVYESAVATLSAYGQRGAVLIFLITAAAAAAGLLLVRDEAHRALLAEAEAAVGVGEVGGHGGYCANCQLPLLRGAAFCLACGRAVAAMPKQHQRMIRAANEQAPPDEPPPGEPAVSGDTA